MTPEDFVGAYEAAFGSQSWDQVSPLVHERASVIFSNGSVHKGKDAVRAAYERNFAAIQNEDYRISDVHWLLTTADGAAYMFDFHWTGLIKGKEVSGAGRGTAVLVREPDGWQLIAEQLGPQPD